MLLADEPSVIVNYITVTIAEIYVCIPPFSVTLLAFGIEHITVYHHIPARFLVTALWEVIMMVTSSADEPSVLIRYFTVTIIKIYAGFPPPAVFCSALGPKPVPLDVEAPACFPVAPRGQPLRVVLITGEIAVIVAYGTAARFVVENAVLPRAAVRSAFCFEHMTYNNDLLARLLITSVRELVCEGEGAG